MKPRLYLASPLFNSIELNQNENLTKILNPFFDVYLPQRDGDLVVELISKGYSISEARQQVFQNDIFALLSSDYLLINLDGRTVDEGACFELGFAYANKVKCFGFQTDIRRLLPHGNNPMIEEPLIDIFKNEEELINWAKNLIIKIKKPTPNIL